MNSLLCAFPLDILNLWLPGGAGGIHSAYKYCIFRYAPLNNNHKYGLWHVCSNIIGFIEFSCCSIEVTPEDVLRICEIVSEASEAIATALLRLLAGMAVFQKRYDVLLVSIAFSCDKHYNNIIVWLVGVYMMYKTEC